VPNQISQITGKPWEDQSTKPLAEDNDSKTKPLHQQIFLGKESLNKKAIVFGGSRHRFVLAARTAFTYKNMKFFSVHQGLEYEHAIFANRHDFSTKVNDDSNCNNNNNNNNNNSNL
jgi:hypothetical protein